MLLNRIVFRFGIKFAKKKSWQIRIKGTTRNPATTRRKMIFGHDLFFSKDETWFSICKSGSLFLRNGKLTPFFIPVRGISLKGVETLYETDAFATQLVDELVSKMATCQVANCGINSIFVFKIYFRIVIRKRKINSIVHEE